jgi:HAD superfamily hydrolase (TIGR01458 family)
MSSSTISHRIRAVLIDLSGTLHVGDEAIPGARDALQRLRASGRKVRFLTNTSTKSSRQLLEHLNEKLNLSISREELVTSVLATARFVERNQLRPLCLMEDPSDLLAGVPEHAGGGGGSSDGAVITRHCDENDEYDSVVVGLAPSHFHYRRLNEAFRILLRHPNNLIAIHRGNYLRDSDGGLSLGPGPFVKALEAAADCRPAIVMGKPSRDFFDSALWEGIPAVETCMIGDDVLGDCQGALRAGIGTAILVQTGKYRPGDETKLTQLTEGEGGDDHHESVESNTFRICPSIVEAIDIVLNSDDISL